MIRCPKCGSTHVMRRVREIYFVDEEHNHGKLVGSEFYAWIETQLVAGYECCSCGFNVGAGHRSVWEGNNDPLPSVKEKA